MDQNYVNHGEVNANWGKVHEELGINFDFKEKAKVKINMENYIERMINELTMKIIKSDMDIT